jgi:AcrR family transcriptional regulator
VTSAGDTDENRAIDLLWGELPPPRRGPRPALSVARIVEAGIALADADGLAAVSMTSVAKALESPLMSLYRHVPSKAALVDVMLDTVIGPPPDLTAVPGGWRGRLEHWALEHGRVFRAHPWALPLVTTRHVVGPNEIGWLEAALDAVSDTGLPPNEMLEVVLLVNAYTRGDAQTGTEPASDPDSEALGWATLYQRIFQRESARTRYPTVASLYDTGTFAHRVESFGLARILDGVQAHIDGAG